MGQHDYPIIFAEHEHAHESAHRDNNIEHVLAALTPVLLEISEKPHRQRLHRASAAAQHRFEVD